MHTTTNPNPTTTNPTTTTTTAAPAWRPVLLVEKNRRRLVEAVRLRLRGAATDETEALADAIADAMAVWQFDVALPEEGAKGIKNKNFGVRLAGTDIVAAPEPPEELADIPGYPQRLVEELAEAMAGKFQVVVSASKVPTTWKWKSRRRYEKIALVETSPETMVRRGRRCSDVRMVSERSIGVTRLVCSADRLYAGTTDRCEADRYWRDCRARSLVMLARYMAERLRRMAPAHPDYIDMARRLEAAADDAWERYRRSPTAA